MKQRGHRRRGLIFVAMVVGGVGWALWRRHHIFVVDYQTIAFVMSSAGSVSGFTRSTRDMIDLFAIKNKTPVKRYISDGTSASVLKLFEQIYADGIRKVIGPMTSQEIDESVQRFIADHADMVVVSPSVTSPLVGSRIVMHNFYRLAPTDDRLVEAYGQLLPVRLPTLKRVLFFARDDAWGKALCELAKKRLKPLLHEVDFQFFLYPTPEHFSDRDELTRTLSGVVDAMRAVLQKSNKDTAIIAFSFGEFVDYIRLVHKDPLFAIPHFGGDMLAYGGVLLADPSVADFLSTIKFEAVAFLANNAFSTKRLALTESFFERQRMYGVSVIVPTQYAFATYDAMNCLALCTTAQDIKNILSNFYGATGYIELDNHGIRTAGTFMGVGFAGDGNRYRWAPFTLIRRDVFFDQCAIAECVLFDVAGGYTITWDASVDVQIKAMGLDLNSIVSFKPVANTFHAMHAEYITLECVDHGVSRTFFIFPVLQPKGMRMYMNPKTKDLWMARATDTLYLGAGADHPVPRAV